MIVRGDCEMHKAAALTLVNVLNAGVNQRGDLSPVERVLALRMLQAVANGEEATIATKLGDPVEEPDKKVYVNPPLAKTQKQAQQPVKRVVPWTLGDGRPFSKWSKPLFNARTGGVNLRGWDDTTIATMVARLAEEYSIPDKEIKEAGLNGNFPIIYQQDAEIIRRLPYGDARYNWLALRFGVGGAPGSKPNKDKIAIVTKLIMEGKIDDAVKVIGGARR